MLYFWREKTRAPHAFEVNVAPLGCRLFAALFLVALDCIEL